jgi:hypothetical protein
MLPTYDCLALGVFYLGNIFTILANFLGIIIHFFLAIAVATLVLESPYSHWKWLPCVEWDKLNFGRAKRLSNTLPAILDALNWSLEAL